MLSTPALGRWRCAPNWPGSTMRGAPRRSPRAGRSARCAPASGSTPASASSAISARTSASIIRYWATTPIWPPASKARPTYHVDIILGERTALQVPQFVMLELDLILVVGKTKPVRIFFLLGDESVRATSAFATLESAHDAMIRPYRRKDWTTALSELESCRSQAPEIGQFVYQLYEQRISDLQASPPPPDWDGVYAALMK